MLTVHRSTFNIQGLASILHKKYYFYTDFVGSTVKDMGLLNRS